jgi:hypothetical protein
MSEWAMHSNSVDSRILQVRLGAFLRGQGSAKQLSLLIDCDERTAFKIRAGETWPIARHWLRIWLEFGDDTLEAVFHPERAEARLIREAEAREQARQKRIASASAPVEDRYFSPASGVGEAARWDDEPADLGPPNLDLFEEARS